MREKTEMIRHRNSESQRGIVLLLAIVALLLISAVGAAILYMAASESGFVGSQRMTARAFYAGMGGLEEGRYRLLPGLQPGAAAIPMGLNYTDPIDLDPLNPPGQVFSCTPSELAGTMVACTTSSVTPVTIAPPRLNNVLYIINNANANPPAPGSNANAPASATNDPFRANEIPNPVILTTGSIQPGAGTQSSVPWVWARVNMKTERATRAGGAVSQDIDLSAATDLDDEPIFSYQGRQYRRPELLALPGGNQNLPPPWGPLPPPNSGRSCIAPICATPVYIVTAYATVPGPTPTGRILRTEISAGTGFSVNSGILSQPGVTMAGTSQYIGYDQCDADCPAGMPGMKGYAAAPPDGHGAIPNCNTVLPIQSSSALGSSSIVGVAADTYPNTCLNSGPAAMTADACIEEGAAFPYNVPQLIAALRPVATTVTPGNYTGLPSGGVSIGGFPPPPYPANLVQGTGADPKITYVPGQFQCTGGCTGSGILMIDCPTCDAANPALRFNASMEFYGIILVNGPVSILGGGTPGSGCNIYGSLIASGAILNTVGGAICFRYNSCAQRDLFRNQPFHQLSFREIPD
jgi:hypothetical protein